MKKFILYIAALFFIPSCELTDVLENEPPNSLVPENVVKNETDARALLNGVYTTITSRVSAYYYMYSELIPSALAGTMSQMGGGAINGQFSINEVLFDNSFARDYWLIFYKTIDQANNSIVLTKALDEDQISAQAKKEIVGEAYFLRAMATFDALRYFGQFFDLNSKLGVILRTEPANFVTRNVPRSTVAESYAQILNDLEIAITDAPDFSVSYRASKIAAKALKAKVLLYQGKYLEAAAIADEVINDGSVRLEDTFESTFAKGLDSSEMILMTHRDENSDSEDNNRKRFYFGRVGTSGWFVDLMKDDPRTPFTYDGTTVLKTNHVDTFRPTYFMRLAEMYLIKAEGLAFSNASVEDSSVPLNVIRNRAGIGDSPAVTMNELKDDLFNETVRELAFENGSEWFAAIRFNKIMTLKPTVTSSNQFILPIPEEEIDGNGSITIADQNPGYE